MNSNYNHLDEDTMESYGNAWIPAIPLPYYHSSIRKAMSFKTNHVYVCGCDARFDNEAAYREHYRTEQMLEMNAKMARTRDLAKAKLLYWRRYAFIMEHGNASEKVDLKLIETPEMKPLADVEVLIARVTDLWEPSYLRWGKENDVSLGRMVDETEVTDDAPERAAKDLDDIAFSHTNSKGVTYFLHETQVTLRGGKKHTIYFFRKNIETNHPKYKPAQLPEEFLVRENPRNGFLTVGRKENHNEG